MAAKKKAKAAAAPKVKAIKEKMSKSQMLNEIAERTELTRKQVNAVFDELTLLINGHLKKTAVGEFVLPGLLKLKRKDKPATKARKGINPFTGEEIMIKAKPASKTVRAVALKKLKEMAQT